MTRPRVLIITGYGINCDDETAQAFDLAGGLSHIVHINDIIANPDFLNSYQVLAFPGGFSYGDDTGSGKALANRIRNNLYQELLHFAGRDTLMLGICNGFQVMVNLGLVPALGGIMSAASVSLEHNNSGRYECRWVRVAVADSPSVFTAGITSLSVPVAHGEGNFYASDDVLQKLKDDRLVVMRYALPDGAPANGRFPENPNGARDDIAAICDPTGRIMGMMPHPERHILFTHRHDWTLLREKARREGVPVPEEGEGLAIFRNAVKYFS